MAKKTDPLVTGAETEADWDKLKLQHYRYLRSLNGADADELALLESDMQKKVDLRVFRKAGEPIKKP